MKNNMALSLDEMISKLDGAAGRLLVASMTDATVREAMEMITEVSIILGEVDEITFVEYLDENEHPDEDEGD